MHSAEAPPGGTAPPCDSRPTERTWFWTTLLGAGMLLPALWGFRPCSAWLWWTMLLATVPSYAAALVVHLVVGYTNVGHLAPVFGGVAVFLLGEVLAFPFLCQPGATEEEWRRFKVGQERRVAC